MKITKRSLIRFLVIVIILSLITFGDYMAGAPVWYKLPAFVLCIVPVGITAGGLTYMSRSVWPAAFLHAAHNNFDQAVFGIITRGDDMMYYVSETGFLTMICAWLIAIMMIVKLIDIASKEYAPPLKSTAIARIAVFECFFIHNRNTHQLEEAPVLV